MPTMKTTFKPITPDHSLAMRTLDPKQRKALELFKDYAVITSAQLARHLGFTQRSASVLCKKWVQTGFLKIVNPSLKARSYALVEAYNRLIT